jgi:glycosyltransferase involved in cell wall biosynthesis
MITVFSLTYNEDVLIQFMIDHYRSRFPNCHIVIYDNSSTDKTVEIAKANGCEVINYNSGGTLNDGLHMQIKNTCWKDAKTDWVLVCDLDELLDINEAQLKSEELIGCTKIKSEGYTMVNMENNLDILNMKYGFRDGGYDKDLLFNKKFITEINYGIGAHQANSSGTIKYSGPYKLYHYKSLSPDYAVARCADTAKRLSSANRSHGWGGACLRSEKEIRDDFEYIRSASTKILK